jgi:hypothetical protein
MYFEEDLAPTGAPESWSSRSPSEQARLHGRVVLLSAPREEGERDAMRYVAVRNRSQALYSLGLGLFGVAVGTIIDSALITYVFAASVALGLITLPGYVVASRR